MPFFDLINLGLRMDEGNRHLRTDPDFETGMIQIPGTKTEESECYMPMSPVLHAELKSYLESRTDDSPYLFPGRSAQTKVKRSTAGAVYSRRLRELPRSRPTWRRTQAHRH